jgi:hypothetical protein
MSVKDALFNTQPESEIDRIEWMAFMSQCYYEAAQNALADGWSLIDLDEVVEMYL